MKEFVVKFPIYVLPIIVLVSLLVGGQTIIWILFGYFLGVRADSISSWGQKIKDKILERNEEITEGKERKEDINE